MIKNVVIVVLVILAVGEGVLLYKSHTQQAMQRSVAGATAMTNLPPAGPNAKGKTPRPIMLSTGMNLKTSPLFQYAYQIAPGAIPDSSKKALVGFNIASKVQSDGSTLVSLTPKDSEDQSQQYTVKSGQTLYFIEQTPVDDKVDQDKDLNYRDDYGIITDSSGVIQ